jgi:hypothetical protein
MPFQPEQGTNAMNRILIASVVATLFAVPALAKDATPGAGNGQSKVQAKEARTDGVAKKKEKGSLDCAQARQGRKIAKPKQVKQKAPAAAIPAAS